MKDMASGHGGEGLGLDSGILVIFFNLSDSMMRSPRSALCPFDTPCPLCPQGTPLKYDSGSSSSNTKKHDVRSIIGSPGRTFHSVHSLDVIQDPRNLERAYEESLKNRPSPVTNSGGSIARGAPVIVPEPGKPHQSALSYEDHQAGHSTAFSSHLHRGSPVSTRESTPRQHEGNCQLCVWCWDYSRARGKSLLTSPVPSKCLSDLFRSSTHSCLQPRLTHGSGGCCPPESLPCARLGPGHSSF